MHTEDTAAGVWQKTRLSTHGGTLVGFTFRAQKVCPKSGLENGPTNQKNATCLRVDPHYMRSDSGMGQVSCRPMRPGSGSRDCDTGPENESNNACAKSIRLRLTMQ